MAANRLAPASSRHTLKPAWQEAINEGIWSGVDQGVDRLLDLVGDRQTTERAVALAASHFDLDEGVDRLIGVYREMGCSA